MGQVEFIDSAGLAALVRAMQQLRTVGGDLVLKGALSSEVGRVMELTRFDQVFTFEPAGA